MWDRLGALAMPVALVTGKLDTKYEALAHKMLRAHRRRRHARIRSTAGTRVPLEQPAVLGGFVDAFAAQHG